jgi:hypothetical protein
MKRDRKALARRKEREERAAASRRATAREVATARARRAAQKPSHVVAPANVQELVKKQLALFRARFGRVPNVGEPLFFDPGEETPTALKATDEQKIAELAHALEAPLELLRMLVASGLVVRTKPDPTPKQQEHS